MLRMRRMGGYLIGFGNMSVIKKAKRKFANTPSDEVVNLRILLEDCYGSIKQARKKGVNTSRAEKLVEEAKKAYSIGSIKSASVLVRRAKREIRKKMNSRDKSRLRVVLSSKNIQSYKRLIDLAKEEHGLTTEKSEGLRLLRKAEEKRRQREYTAAEALAWKGKKILEKEMKKEKFHDSCEELIHSSENLLNYIKNEDIEIKTKNFEKELIRTRNALREENYEECLSKTSVLFSSLFNILGSKKIEELRKTPKEIEGLKEKVLKIMMRTKELKSIKDEHEDTEQKIGEIENELCKLKEREELRTTDDQERKECIRDFIELERKKMLKKIDFISERYGFKKRLECIENHLKRDLEKTDPERVLKKMTEIDIFLDEIILGKVTEDEMGSQRTKIMLESEEELSEIPETDEEKVKRIFKHSARINLDNLDFSSDSLFFLYPTFPQKIIEDIDGKKSFLKWTEHSTKDYETIIKGLKKYDELFDPDRIILAKMTDLGASKDLVIFSNPERKEILRILSEPVKEKAYIDSSRNFESVLSRRISCGIGATVIDITLNAMEKSTETGTQLLKDLC